MIIIIPILIILPTTIIRVLKKCKSLIENMLIIVVAVIVMVLAHAAWRY